MSNSNINTLSYSFDPESSLMAATGIPSGIAGSTNIEVDTSCWIGVDVEGGYITDLVINPDPQGLDEDADLSTQTKTVLENLFGKDACSHLIDKTTRKKDTSFETLDNNSTKALARLGLLYAAQISDPVNPNHVFWDLEAALLSQRIGLSQKAYEHSLRTIPYLQTALEKHLQDQYLKKDIEQSLLIVISILDSYNFKEAAQLRQRYFPKASAPELTEQQLQSLAFRLQELEPVGYKEQQLIGIRALRNNAVSEQLLHRPLDLSLAPPYCLLASPNPSWGIDIEQLGQNQIQLSVTLAPQTNETAVKGCVFRAIDKDTNEPLAIEPLTIEQNKAISTLSIPKNKDLDDLIVEITSRPLQQVMSLRKRQLLTAYRFADSGLKAQRLEDNSNDPTGLDSNRDFGLCAKTWGELGDVDRQLLAQSKANTDKSIPVEPKVSPWVNTVLSKQNPQRPFLAEIALGQNKGLLK